MAEEKWDIVIKPREKLLSVDFGELWRYRDLCSLFVKRNIVVQYKQTILGPLWYVIQPMITVVMYMVVFGGIPDWNMIYDMISGHLSFADMLERMSGDEEPMIYNGTFKDKSHRRHHRRKGFFGSIAERCREARYKYRH